MGRLAHGIHAKSAPQAYRAGDKGQRAMRLTQQLSKPGLWHVSPSLPLIRTPWHHLSSYQSLVFGMYRQACSSYALLGTTSAATNARFLACIASACSSYALLGTTSAAIEALVPSMHGLWHVSPAPAAHAHSLAPPHQLSPRLPSSQFELL
jgi:hypothetical protein